MIEKLNPARAGLALFDVAGGEAIDQGVRVQ
jgi:hypothetical protein